MPDLNALSLDDLFSTLARGGRVRRLLEIARDEDLGDRGDITTDSIIDAAARGEAQLVMREVGVVSGLAAIPMLFDVFESEIAWRPRERDGRVIASAPITLGSLSGPLRDILIVERTLLNLVGRLSGIATLARRYVEAVRSTNAVICDTRKTTPGLRALEKYAVRCGGAALHRIGLYDAVLYKDNHLAHIPPDELTEHVNQAARRARSTHSDLAFVEVEVDSLGQLDRILACEPGLIDIVLLDNMSLEDLREARRRVSDTFSLEASGGVTLETVRAIAETGVDRISVGAITHHAVSLDVGLDIEASG